MYQTCDCVICFSHSSEFAAGRCHFKIQGWILNLVLFSFASHLVSGPQTRFECCIHEFWNILTCVSRIVNDIDDLIVTCASPLLIDLCCVTNVNLVRKLKILKHSDVSSWPFCSAEGLWGAGMNPGDHAMTYFWICIAVFRRLLEIEGGFSNRCDSCFFDCTVIKLV